MKTKMTSEEVGEKAKNYFESGYNCAEATAKAVIEGFGGDASHAIAHATAFGGGFARSGEEACGVLCGAFIAIGHFYPRKTPTEPYDEAILIGTQIRKRFIEIYGATRCKDLKGQFDKKEWRKSCAGIVQQTSSDLFDLLCSKV